MKLKLSKAVHTIFDRVIGKRCPLHKEWIWDIFLFFIFQNEQSNASEQGRHFKARAKQLWTEIGKSVRRAVSRWRQRRKRASCHPEWAAQNPAGHMRNNFQNHVSSWARRCSLKYETEQGMETFDKKKTRLSSIYNTWIVYKIRCYMCYEIWKIVSIWIFYILLSAVK